jgi:hypothetical protein
MKAAVNDFLKKTRHPCSHKVLSSGFSSAGEGILPLKPKPPGEIPKVLYLSFLFLFQKPGIEPLLNLTADECLDPYDALERSDLSFNEFIKGFVICGMNSDKDSGTIDQGDE